MILHDIDGGSRPQEQEHHSIGERLQEGFQEIKQRLSILFDFLNKTNPLERF